MWLEAASSIVVVVVVGVVGVGVVGSARRDHWCVVVVETLAVVGVVLVVVGGAWSSELRHRR
jgi:hypothetical protein